MWLLVRIDENDKVILKKFYPVTSSYTLSLIRTCKPKVVSATRLFHKQCFLSGHCLQLVAVGQGPPALCLRFLHHHSLSLACLPHHAQLLINFTFLLLRWLTTCFSRLWWFLSWTYLAAFGCHLFLVSNIKLCLNHLYVYVL